jgi:hypothetical protein
MGADIKHDVALAEGRIRVQGCCEVTKTPCQKQVKSRAATLPVRNSQAYTLHRTCTGENDTITTRAAGFV